MAALEPPPGFEATDSGVLVPQKEYPDDFDIIALMREAKDPDTGLLRDLKIDDSDLASASSYYDYSFRIVGEDAHPPWLIQMWIGLFLFAEVCPCCSNPKWMSLQWVVENVDKATPSESITEHLKILKHGICPKCKRTKHELIKKHGLVNYVELTSVLGQRSGKSSSAAGGYAPYQLHRYLKFPRLATLTKAMQKSTELTGTFVSLTFAKAVSLVWTPFINVVNEARWFCLAEGSLVSMASGELKPIEAVEVGDMVVTGSTAAQPVVNTFDNGYKECFEIVLDDGKVLTSTAEHKFRCVHADGTQSWVELSDLNVGDSLVVS